MRRCAFSQRQNRSLLGHHALMEKLVADPGLRKEHHKPLRFPLERYYRANGFQDEEEDRATGSRGTVTSE